MRTTLRNKIIILIIRCQFLTRDIPTTCRRDLILLKVIKTIVRMIKIHIIGTIATITENIIKESSIIIKDNKGTAINNHSSHILKRQQATIHRKDTPINRRTICNRTSNPRIILRGTAVQRLVQCLDPISDQIRIKEIITKHPGYFHDRIIPIRSNNVIIRQI